MADSIHMGTSMAAARAVPQAAPAATQAAAPVAMAAAAPAARPAAEPKATPKFDPQKMLEHMQEIVERLNEQMKQNNRALGFSVDHKINTFVVTVRDSSTGEVVRQIPNEVVVNFAHSLEDLKGLLFNEKL